MTRLTPAQLARVRQGLLWGRVLLPLAASDARCPAQIHDAVALVEAHGALPPLLRGIAP